jgi:hypothetical protein
VYSRDTSRGNSREGGGGEPVLRPTAGERALAWKHEEVLHQRLAEPREAAGGHEGLVRAELPLGGCGHAWRGYPCVRRR